LLSGLMLAQYIGGNRLIVQSDCMGVVEIMENEGFTANSAAAIYDECNIVWSGFQDVGLISQRPTRIPTGPMGLLSHAP
jgi:hypothetical protein